MAARKRQRDGPPCHSVHMSRVATLLRVADRALRKAEAEERKAKDLLLRKRGVVVRAEATARQLHLLREDMLSSYRSTHLATATRAGFATALRRRGMCIVSMDGGAVLRCVFGLLGRQFVLRGDVSRCISKGWCRSAREHMDNQSRRLVVYHGGGARTADDARVTGFYDRAEGSLVNGRPRYDCRGNGGVWMARNEHGYWEVLTGPFSTVLARSTTSGARYPLCLKWHRHVASPPRWEPMHGVVCIPAVTVPNIVYLHGSLSRPSLMGVYRRTKEDKNGRARFLAGHRFAGGQPVMYYTQGRWMVGPDDEGHEGRGWARSDRLGALLPLDCAWDTQCCGRSWWHSDTAMRCTTESPRVVPGIVVLRGPVAGRNRHIGRLTGVYQRSGSHSGLPCYRSKHCFQGKSPWMYRGDNGWWRVGSYTDRHLEDAWLISSTCGSLDPHGLSWNWVVNSKGDLLEKKTSLRSLQGTVDYPQALRIAANGTGIFEISGVYQRREELYEGFPSFEKNTRSGREGAVSVYRSRTGYWVVGRTTDRDDMCFMRTFDAGAVTPVGCVWLVFCNDSDAWVPQEITQRVTLKAQGFWEPFCLSPPKKKQPPV